MIEDDRQDLRDSPGIDLLHDLQVEDTITRVFNPAWGEGTIDLIGETDCFRSDLSQVTTVTSFFISRVESTMDRALEEIGETELQGTTAHQHSDFQQWVSRMLDWDCLPEGDRFHIRFLEKTSIGK